MTGSSKAGPKDVGGLYLKVQELQKSIDSLWQSINRIEYELDNMADAPRNDQEEDASTLDWQTAEEIDARMARRKLAAFVDFLVERHDFYPYVRPCWFEHPPAVEELTALWKARQAAFAPDADAYAANWWQDYLERSQPRLRRIFARCRIGHVAQPRSWMNDADRARRAAWLKSPYEAPLDPWS